MKKPYLQYVGLALLILLISYSCSKIEEVNFKEDFDLAKMNQLFANIEEKNLGMGSVSIFKDGKEDYRTSFGNIDVEGSVPATAATKYRVGSISKVFTATLIMQLIDEGKLSLDTKLATFLPEIPNAAIITVQHLLQHRSGLFNYTNGAFEPGRELVPGTRQELLEFFIENATVFQPGTKGEYSNTNYVLLSFIVEDIDGKTYEDALNDRIVSPLGLQDTYNGTVTDPDRGEAFSYFLEADNWVRAPETHYTLLQGAGSVLSTPTGVNAFYEALFNGKLVSQVSLKNMQTIVDDFGLGLFQIPFYSKSGFGHTGSIDGYRSSSVYFPSDDVSITYVANGVSMDINDIMIAALSIYSGLPYNLP